MKWRDAAQGVGIPAAVFVAVWALHFLWHGLFPERDPVQEQWVQIAAGNAWWDRYAATQSYWLGFSYAFSLMFATHAFQRYRRDRFCAGRNLAVGSVTLGGFLAVAGCFLIGCCGSPMLAVYLSMFGTAFIPMAKPFIAFVTSVTIAGAWIYLHFRRPKHTQCSATSEFPCEYRPSAIDDPA